MRNEEHKIQADFFELCELVKTKYPVFGAVFAVPNGGKRDKITAKKLKYEGVKSGIPDVIVMYRNEHCNGLAIEFKSEKGRLTKNQKHWMKIFEQAGFKCIVCRSAYDAYNFIFREYKL